MQFFQVINRYDNLFFQCLKIESFKIKLINPMINAFNYLSGIRQIDSRLVDQQVHGWVGTQMDGWINRYIFSFSFVASLWETNPGTIRIFSNQVTATFLIESDENNYIGFQVAYSAFNSTGLNSKYRLFFCLHISRYFNIVMEF